MNTTPAPVTARQLAGLDDVEIRVLGCLLEKAILTPNHYPLTMHGLRNACNQKTARHPLVSWHEHVLHGALETLTSRGLVQDASSPRARKICHRLHEVLGLEDDELAVLCVLMLRGPQSVRAILANAGRLHPFRDPAGVESTLQALLNREAGPLVVALPQKDTQHPVHFCHCIGAIEQTAADASIEAHATPARNPADESAGKRTRQMEKELARMRTELDTIQRLLRHDDN